MTRLNQHRTAAHCIAKSFITCILVFGTICYSRGQCRCNTGSTCTCPALAGSNINTVCSNWPPAASKITITLGGYWRVIKCNGIPNHNVGQFPLTALNPTENCCIGRPEAMTEQDFIFVMPAYSFDNSARTYTGTPYYLPTPPYTGKPEVAFGVAVNGVPLDPAAAEWWDKTNYKWALNPLKHPEMVYNLDCNNAHVHLGIYHYHGFPQAVYDSISTKQRNDPLNSSRYRIALMGWAFDGNPIYGEECGLDNNGKITPTSSYKLKSPPILIRTVAGLPAVNKPQNSIPLGSFVDDYYYLKGFGTLDECNGHFGKTPEFPNGVYHYHLTKTFPYISRCYMIFSSIYLPGPPMFSEK